MMFAFSSHADRLVRLESPAELTRAIWIDLYRPMPQQVAAVEELGVEVPTLADMEEIEISNRLYRDEGNEYMTVVLPGLSETRAPTSGPVTFILSPERMITVRHHAPRPFETFPDRAYRTGAGCESPERLFLGLMEEIIGRLADLLESTGRSLDTLAATVYRNVESNGRTDQLQLALEQAGQQGELIGRVRLSLLTLERAISYFGQTLGNREPDKLRPIVKGLMRDITALEVHADFLSQRVALATDSTLGMINLAQNMTVRIVSVVAALFLPPTLIASIYGMNFEVMPELQWVAGYPFALALMLASAIGTYLFFRWRRWL